jgi:hypothetical protein
MLAPVAACVAAVVIVLLGSDTTDSGTVNTHRAEVGEPALVSVAGDTHEDVASEDLADLRRGKDDVNRLTSTRFPELGPVYMACSFHDVRSSGRWIG